ncbi:5'-3' exoribonuclease 1, partial [Hyalella azteca]|uniref:5'-3' exoribonuclease 1 n=1 Tax=Hyalella azteca TaxID=294128 RepID=A0A8B7PN01_HYAAZ
NRVGRVYEQAFQQSIILEVPDAFFCPHPSYEWFKKIAQELLNKIVYVDWPHLKEALVVGLSCGRFRVSLLPGASSMLKLEVFTNDNPLQGTTREQREFVATAKGLRSDLLYKWGIDAGRSSLLVHCKPIAGRRYVVTSCGEWSLSYEWSPATQTYLAQTLVRDIAVCDPTLPKTCSLDQLFPAGTKVFMLGQPHHGCCATVLENSPSNKADAGTNDEVLVRVETRHEPDLSRLKSSVPGHKYLHDTCMIQAYNAKFPRVVEAVCRTRGDVTEEELFPGPDGEAECDSLVDFLMESEGARSVRRSFGSELLVPEAVAELLHEVDNYNKLQHSQPVEMRVKAQMLFKPNPLQGSVPVKGPVETKVWDRVFHVREGHVVPLGARGTVIGLQPASQPTDVLYDVAFDEVFSGGQTL